MALARTALRSANRSTQKQYASAFAIDRRLNPEAHGKTFAVKNPLDDSEVARVQAMDESAIKETIKKAVQGQKQWQKRSLEERVQLLRDWYKAIMDHQEYLGRLMTTEQGKPLSEAKGEVAYGASFIQFFAEQASRSFGETMPPIGPNKRIMVTREPVGLSACITPWNFPMAMITRKAGAALAAGCAMIVRPANATPLTAIATIRLAYEVGIPENVLPIITTDHDMTSTAGKMLAESPDIRKLSFTGSTNVGKLLMGQAASTIKKVSLELGGNAPFIVFDDANIDKAVEGLMQSKFRNAGQTCVCANRIYLQRGIADEFTQKLEKVIRDLKVGDGMEDGVQIGPLISKEALEKVEDLMEESKRGGKVVVGGDRHELGGNFYQPTLVVDVKDESSLFVNEIFGPVAAVTTFNDEEELLARSNNTMAGLVAYYYTNDIGRTIRVGEGLEYGMVGHNTGLLSTAMAPFGGVKESGLGREGSHYGLEEYTELKYWNMNFF